MAEAESESLPAIVGGKAKVEASESGRRIDEGCTKKVKRERVCTAKERISRMPPCAAGKRSSIYRGVTRHRWTGRFEAHLWDKSTWNQSQNKKGKQVYLGAYDDEEAAARAYDLAALKYWGAGTLINFPVTDYARDLEEMQMVTKEDYLVSLRRKSSAFSRRLQKYQVVSRQPQSRWDSSMAPNDYYNNFSCSSSWASERKIDLTSYIRWWAPSKSRKSEVGPTAEDELQAMKCPTEPYQLPSLGLPRKGNPQSRSSSSACSILSRSAAFNNFLEKSSDRVKSVPGLFSGGELDGSYEYPIQRTQCPMPPLLRTDWNSAQQMKNEEGISTYTCHEG